MALISCPECGGTISDAADNCPRCGYPLKGETITVKEKSNVNFFGYQSTLAIGKCSKGTVIGLVDEIHGSRWVDPNDVKHIVLSMPSSSGLMSGWFNTVSPRSLAFLGLDWHTHSHDDFYIIDKVSFTLVMKNGTKDAFYLAAGSFDLPAKYESEVSNMIVKVGDFFKAFNIEIYHD
ncbi:MAG: hypothetical protein J6O18_08520 [Bacilli bacterium]|nr:hypothetical protein [Bacilli bacterium]